MKILTRDVMRYLGYGGAEPDERVSALVKELSAEFAAKTAPKNVYGIWECKVDSSSVAFAGIIINSKNLAGCMENCSRAVLLAVTLGQEADTLIRCYSILDMEKAVIAQAVCTAMIEAYCDETESKVAQRQELCGLFAVKRFSPGYGDFNIACQRDIINLLHCDTKIGLTLTSGYMLAPSKSVTAVIGFGKERKQSQGKYALPGRERACSDCAETECEFRENE